MSRTSANISRTFEQVLKLFVTTTAKSMEYAREASQMALEHFQKHGDTGYLQRFLDAMPKNYTRREAYLKWLVDFAPVKMEQGKLLKVPGSDHSAIDLAAAFKKAFWDHHPERDIENFTAENVVVGLQRVVKRYHNANRYKATDDNAVTVLDLAEQLVEQLKEQADDIEGNTSNVSEAEEAEDARKAAVAA